MLYISWKRRRNREKRKKKKRKENSLSGEKEIGKEEEREGVGETILVEKRKKK